MAQKSGPARVSVQEMRKKLQSGDGSLLVCIYDQEDYDDSHLDGSISMDDFEKRLPKLPKNAEFVFY